MNKKSNIIIAVDGYSSCGKSTLAKQLSAYYNIKYVDTGAMYRAVTLFALQNNIDVKSEIGTSKLISLLDEVNIDFKYNQEKKTSETILNDANVEQEIRTPKVSGYVSYVSKIKAVREKMVALQRQMGNGKGLVMDGRDIGTVVFPGADVKLFVTADIMVRAKRRFNDFIKDNPNITIEEVSENLKKRDHIDTTRAESPLLKADDAIVIDNTNLNKEEQLNLAIEIISKQIEK